MNFDIESFTIDVKEGKSSLTSCLISFRITPQLDGLPLNLCSNFGTTWKSLPVILIFLPKRSNFKATVKETKLKESKLFLRVKHLFLTLLYCQIFLAMFQSVKPKIYIDFSEITKLLRAIIAKFVISKLLYVNNNGA